MRSFLGKVSKVSGMFHDTPIRREGRVREGKVKSGNAVQSSAEVGGAGRQDSVVSVGSLVSMQKPACPDETCK